MNWFSFLLPFLKKFASPTPTQSAGGAAYQGMETPSYEAPATSSIGQRLGQGAMAGVQGAIGNQRLGPKGTMTGNISLQDIYKLFLQ